jgi:hypothetical protein
MPKKIAIGMGIAALAFVVMAVGSYMSNLPLHKDIITLGSSSVKVTPFLLMHNSLILGRSYFGNKRNTQRRDIQLSNGKYQIGQH